jgi:O-acetyl-ADP-ribose deacetylase (regulator of RNase III)
VAGAIKKEGGFKIEK